MKLTSLEWSRVEELQRKSYYVGNLVFEAPDRQLLQRAIKEDKERYSQYALQLRADYSASFLPPKEGTE